MRSGRALDLLAIVTADRPDAFRRCLLSYIDHARRHAIALPIIVADGSRRVANSRSIATIVRNASRRTGASITIAGRAEVRRLRKAAIAEGVPPRVIDWLLPERPTGFAPGAVRNRVLLASAGRRVLSADDDTVCQVWSPSRVHDGIAFVSHDDPRETAFFDDRQSAIASARECGRSLFHAHANLLGRRAPKRRGVVRATWTGLAGDAAVHCPYTTLFATGRLRDELAADGAAFISALRSREVRRAPRRNTIVDADWLMMYCAAFDNAALLPPCSPTGANEDGLFATMLRACEPEAFIGQIPLGIVHDSDRKSAYRGTGIPSASEIRMSDAVGALTREWAASARERRVGDRMRGLSRHLIEWSRLRRTEMKDELIRLALSRKAGLLDRCEALLAGAFPYPRHWRIALERYRVALGESLTDHNFWIPTEHRASGAAVAIAGVRAHVESWGEALEVWPDVRELARRIDQPC